MGEKKPIRLFLFSGNELPAAQCQTIGNAMGPMNCFSPDGLSQFIKVLWLLGHGAIMHWLKATIPKPPLIL